MDESKPYLEIRKLLAKIFLNPRIRDGNLLPVGDDIRAFSSGLSPEIEPVTPRIKSEFLIKSLPRFTPEITRLNIVSTSETISIKPLSIKDEQIFATEFVSKSDVNLRSLSWEADVHIKLTPVIGYPAVRQEKPEKTRLKLKEVSRFNNVGRFNVRRPNIRIPSDFRVDIGAACRIPIFLRPVNPRKLEKKRLLRYWNALLEQTPGGVGSDLELMAIFRNILVDHLKEFEFNAISLRLKVFPRMPSERLHEHGKRYDIIYGRYIPRGTIIRAVVGSDSNR